MGNKVTNNYDTQCYKQMELVQSFFSKMIFSISFYKLQFLVNSSYTFTAHRPLFLGNATKFYLSLLPPPDSFQRHKGVKHWYRETLI